jgi:hypothetical protein
VNRLTTVEASHIALELPIPQSALFHDSATRSAAIWSRVHAYAVCGCLGACSFDDQADLGHGFGVAQIVEVEQAGGEGVELDGEVDGHERVDEELASGSAGRRVPIAEFSLDGRADLVVDDARPVSRVCRAAWALAER